MLRTALGVGFLTALGGALAACALPFDQGGAQAQPADPALLALLVQSVGPGYQVDRRATGLMGLDEAAYSAPMPQGLTSEQLKAHGFRGAAARVWRSGDDFITLAVYAFPDDDAARAFVDSLVSYLAKDTLGETYPSTHIPLGTGFELTSTTKGGDRPIFCDGEMFSFGPRAYLVDNCGSQPESPAVAADIAKSQYERAFTADFGGTAGSPSPGR